MQVTRRQDGVVLVEFALILPVLVAIVFGFLKFGIAMNAKLDSTHLTAEGTRYIVVNQNPGLSDTTISPQTMANYIRSRADTSFLKGASVCISYPNNPEVAGGSSGKVGDPVNVKMTRVYTIIPLFGPLTVISEATMRLEALPTKVPAECI